MSFRVAFTCQVSKQLKNKPANVFFCLHWEQVFGHLISRKQAQEYWQSAYGDVFSGKRRYHWKGVQSCPLTTLDVILENGSDPSSNALATYLLVFIVPSQQGLERDQFLPVTLYVLELKWLNTVLSSLFPSSVKEMQRHPNIHIPALLNSILCQFKPSNPRLN